MNRQLTSSLDYYSVYRSCSRLFPLDASPCREQDTGLVQADHQDCGSPGLRTTRASDHQDCAYRCSGHVLFLSSLLGPFISVSVPVLSLVWSTLFRACQVWAHLESAAQVIAASVSLLRSYIVTSWRVQGRSPSETESEVNGS